MKIHWKFWKRQPSLNLYKNIIKRQPFVVCHEILSIIIAWIVSAWITVWGISIGGVVYGLTGAIIVKCIIIIGAIWYAYSSSASSKAKGRGGGGAGTRDLMASGHLLNTRTSSEPIGIHYGDCRIGGNIVYISSTGTTNEYLHIVMTVGEGPVEGIVTKTYELLTLDVAPGDTGWKVNDKITGATSNQACYIVQVLTTLTYTIRDRTGAFTLGEILSNGTNAADQGLANPVVSASTVDGTQIWLDDKLIVSYGTDAAYEFFTGTSAQIVCATLQGYDPNWDEAMRYTAYIYIRLHYNEEKFASMPQITMRLKGRKIYDPRNGSTAYSNNNALVAYDFLRNDRYSIGLPANVFDEDSIKDAANWCYPNGYEFNGSIMTYQTILDNLDDILRNFRSAIIWGEGEYKLLVYEYDMPVMSLTEDEIVTDSFKINIPGIPETPNRCVVNYIDAVDNYLSKQRIIEDPDAVLLYDMEERDFNLDLIGTTTAEYAEKLGAYYVERNRLNYQFSFSCSARALALEPLDMIKITHYLPGWDEAILRVVDITYNQNDGVKLTVIAEDPDLYDDTVDIDIHNAYTTNLPFPLDHVIIGTPLIVDGSITTEKLATGAITNQWEAKDDQTFYLDNQVYMDILDLPVTSHGGIFLIIARCFIVQHDDPGYIYFQLLRDAVVIDGEIKIQPAMPIEYEGDTDLPATGTVIFLSLDIPAAGAVTYTIQGKNDVGSAVLLKNIAIEVCEFLK